MLTKPTHSEKKGSIVLLEKPFEMSLSKRNFELPESISVPPPPALIKEVWGEDEPVLSAFILGDSVHVVLYPSREVQQAETGRKSEEDAPGGCKDLGEMTLDRARQIATDNGIELEVF